MISTVLCDVHRRATPRSVHNTEMNVRLELRKMRGRMPTTNHFQQLSYAAIACDERLRRFTQWMAYPRIARSNAKPTNQMAILSSRNRICGSIRYFGDTSTRHTLRMQSSRAI